MNNFLTIRIKKVRDVLSFANSQIYFATWSSGPRAGAATLAPQGEYVLSTVPRTVIMESYIGVHP